MAHLNAQIAAQTAKVEELLAMVRKILAITGSDGIDMEEISQKISQATDEAVRRALQKLEGLDVSSLLYRVDHADRILADILLLLDAKGMAPQADGILVENLDNPTHIDQTRIDVTSVVPGSSEIDVISDPEVGKEYILSDGVDSQEMVRVISVMRGGNTIRAKLEAPVKEAYRNGKGVLTRSTALISGGGAYIGGGEENSVLTPNIVDWQGEVISSGATSASAAFNTATKENYDISGAAMFMMGGVSLAQFVGLSMMHPEQGIDGWRYVDHEGNLLPELNALLGDGKKQERFAWFDSWGLTSPQSLVTEIIDGQHMVRFNKGYAKSWTGKPGSHAAGKFCIGASSGPVEEDLISHPAFRNYIERVPIDCFWMGKYLGSYDEGKDALKSVPEGNIYQQGKDFRIYTQKCLNRNVAGVRGFHAKNYWEVAWINLLMFLKAGNGDTYRTFSYSQFRELMTEVPSGFNVLGLEYWLKYSNGWADGLRTVGSNGDMIRMKIFDPTLRREFLEFEVPQNNNMNNFPKSMLQGPMVGGLSQYDLGLLMWGRDFSCEGSGYSLNSLSETVMRNRFCAGGNDLYCWLPDNFSTYVYMSVTNGGGGLPPVTRIAKYPQ